MPALPKYSGFWALVRAKRIGKMAIPAALGCAIVVSLATSPAQSQQFPTDVVHLIVPFAAGGPIDVFGRRLAEALRVSWQQPVIVENKPGAGNVLGIQAAVNARPDGHTLIIIPDPALTVDPIIRTKLPYKPESDLASITTLITYPQVIVENATVPARSLKELVEISKKRPINYGSYGPGTAPHLILELFKQQSGAEMIHIPYAGSAPAILALTKNEVQVTVGGIGTMKPHVEAGTFRILAVEGETRSPLIPDVQTFAEAGYPKVRAPAWWGIFAPAGTPASIIEKINVDVGEALKTPEMKQLLVQFGYNPGKGGPEELKKNIRLTRELWEPLVRSLDIKIN